MPSLLTSGRPFFAGVGVAALLALGPGALHGQEFLGPGHGFTCVRRVQAPGGAALPRVVVTEFFTHGELRPDGGNLAVYDAQDRPIPWRVLQAGPGDFCRVAFQTAPKQSAYRVFYGGKAAPKPPRWTASAGLLLRTFRWRACDLNSLPSVRAALAAAEPSGADFVPQVFHRHDPFRPGAGPFLSHYAGTLRAGTAGKYLFFTSSQDCSFLLIDGKVVVSAPGAHGPTGEARFRGEVTLAAGPHEFEYVHAAAGPDACMVAAWQPPGAGRPEVIPGRAFGDDVIAHLDAGAPRHVTRGALRDFTVEVLGDVAVGDDLTLVRVRFVELPVRRGAVRARRHWDFGDGQVSDAADPVHVYLAPGLYKVKMAPAGGTGPAVVNRVQVQRATAPPEGKKGPDRLADYVPIVSRYDTTKLDLPGALRLVRFCLEVGQAERAVRVGKAKLLAAGAAEEEQAVYDLARLVGPLLRDGDDAAGAFAVWQALGRAVRQPQWKAACELEAADVCLNDLLQRAESKPLLESAAAHLAQAPQPALAGRLQRVWGDWHARGGDGAAARQAYARAAALAAAGTAAERDARRGAFARSAEAFLREKSLERAAAELRRWQDEFPADKVEGYLPLLQARYFAARGKYQHAVVAAGDLLAVNRDSPYADRLVYLAAECEEKLGRPDRARAGYQSLLTDYPGSPLVPTARQKLAAPAGPAKATKPLRK